MKVCTDACLFGAWVSKRIEFATVEIISVFDIGTGTGLLSLMLAQAANNVMIDAVEIDPAAAMQASQNAAASPFTDRIKVINANLLDYTPLKQYDVIISNPPFFENDLKSDHAGKNKAKHDDGLTLSKLAKSINGLSAPAADVALLLPFHRMDEAESLMLEQGFQVAKKALVYQTTNHKTPFRVMWIFRKAKTPPAEETIFIKDEMNLYTDHFVELLKPYYLKL